MTTTPARLAVGFGAAALSHVIFQGALGTILYAGNLVPDLVWSLEPVPPFGVPRTVNNMFWDGLWGMLYGLLEPRLTARFGRLPGGLVLGLASLLVLWFVVLPLKGAGIGSGFHGGRVAIQAAFDLTFGVGTAILFRAGLDTFRKETPMKGFAVALAAFAALGGVVAHMAPASGQSNGEVATVLDGKLPPGYRDWTLISVAREEGSLNDLRAILGNDVAVAASRDGTLPYPDGSIIARLAWNHHPLEESEKAFGRHQSFVAGAPKNGVQFMVKDSKKYAATGGWGFAHFNDGKPAGEAVLNTCFSCHETAKDRDFVFNRYAP